ncbi:flagellar basal body-associated FliL family protein [Oleidesulfovibrio sp.]|uniref:flagellar basal body-associated FliL family protein n=1 Tax=Oleidesulfovibrio sp. TaxID=2909707 RepID=UPI003A8ACB16
MAEEVTQEKKGGKLKWIIMIVLLLVLAGGGAFAYFTFFAGGGDTAQEEQVQQGEETPEDVQIVTLPTFLVNLSDPLGRRYLKMTLDVEVINPKAGEELNRATARIQDAIILLLSSKSYADLAPLENKLLLKNEIVARLNQILGGSKVRRVYFTEMVIQ